MGEDRKINKFSITGPKYVNHSYSVTVRSNQQVLYSYKNYRRIRSEIFSHCLLKSPGEIGKAQVDFLGVFSA